MIGSKRTPFTREVGCGLPRFFERFDVGADEYEPIELGSEDYLRHMWVDTTSREYEEWLLSVIAGSVNGFSWPPKGYENILLETEG